MERPKVIIAGGGVAGLSAAHELVTRGFDVEVYEYHDIPGGKARSLGIPGTGSPADHRHDLPAEHGFRFFPGYYRHVIDTMKHIPYWQDDETVYDHLTAVDKEALTSFSTRAIILPAKMPTTLRGFFQLWRQSRRQPKINFEKGELRHYFRCLWQIVTSCHERRDDEYEQIPWWVFVGAENRSVHYQSYLANISRTLVAADPKKVSTRTNGNVWIQTLMGMWGSDGDRVLEGPTNEVWIYPWLKFLLENGVKYYINASVEEILAKNQEVTGVRVTHANSGRPGALHQTMARVLDCDRYGITQVEAVNEHELVPTGDYYVSAVPVERMAEILTNVPEGLVSGEVYSDAQPEPDTHLVHPDDVEDVLVTMDPQFGRIEKLQYSVQWMNGIQFYLKASDGSSKPPYLPGHHVHVDAPFALTSIFQTHYWEGIDLANYGDGTVQAICSVDISDWSDANGRIYDKYAIDLTRAQVFEEVWTDIKTSFRHNPQAALTDDNLVTWNLDSDITELQMMLLKNREPLLVNRVNTWRLRPTSHTRVRNLFLASDYVRTHTDLATMEGANEAARNAVNGILDVVGSDQPRCRTWKLKEPDALKPFREYDLEKYRLGKAWSKKFPWRIKLRFYWQIFKTLLGIGKMS